MVLLPVPVVEIAAHYIGYMVRIVEFHPRRRGHFAKCVGSLSLWGLPVAAWAVMRGDLLCAVPALLFFILVGITGYKLEELEEREASFEAIALRAALMRRDSIIRRPTLILRGARA